MTLEEAYGWLIVRLDESERMADLDWSGLIMWKIPEYERAYVPDIDIWIVHGKHRQLINALFFIYQVMGNTEARPSVDLRKAQRMIELLEQWKPEPAVSERATEETLSGKPWPDMYRFEPN